MNILSSMLASTRRRRAWHEWRLRHGSALACVVCALLTSTGAEAAGKPGGGGAAMTSYVGQDLGTLSGHTQSYGSGVNASGHVVGKSAGDYGPSRAFYWNGSMRDLTSPGASASEAYAISSGATEYAVGIETIDGLQYAVIWTAPSSSTSAQRLDATAGCSANGVNDSGTAVGSCGVGGGAVWISPGATRRDIPALNDNFAGAAVDIDNRGVIVGNSQRRTTSLMSSYVWQESMVAPRVLPPATGDVDSYATAVSDVFRQNGSDFVYVVGSSAKSPGFLKFGATRAVRWTVPLDGGDIVTTILSQSLAAGVNNLGDVAGTVSGKGGKDAATLWRSPAYISLKPPKGGTASGSYDLARETGSLTYVTGVAAMGVHIKAMRWVVN